MYGIVYCAFCTSSGKYYVGQTTLSLERRKAAHFSPRNSCLAFKAALAKYGPKSFAWSVLTECSSQEELNRAEDYWIEFLKGLVPFGYNLKKAGARGKASEETRLRMKEAQNNLETKKRKSDAIREVFANPLVKKRLSLSSQESQNRTEVIEKKRIAMLGRKRSLSSRLNQSISQRGKKRSETARKNLSIGIKKYWEKKKNGSP